MKEKQNYEAPEMLVYVTKLQSVIAGSPAATGVDDMSGVTYEEWDS